jgi:hypothetical protein
LNNTSTTIQYLKKVFRNTGAESNKKNGFQQLQRESCQPIKRLKDKKKNKKKNKKKRRRTRRRRRGILLPGVAAQGSV